MEDGMSDIANFGFSNSGGQEVKEQIQENVEEISKSDKGKEEGGLINNLISNLMSPRVGEAKNKERNDLFEVKDEENIEEKSGNDNTGDGGIINNLISNIFHPVENQENNNSGVGGQKSEMRKTEEESGSVLDNIISNLPTPLADDAVPATDEASILIHSIVHD
ncbi:uncharacterized protein LOC129881569 [Solanum dulcamara]|uniref:uncharacterized protein LOC129881569 n=1 Tax=Solanum dulcamara TaxID=45834 RepID=UPI002485FD18|nr:uncharacterized protein LOC129881569 [Solanum dulcamara]